MKKAWKWIIGIFVGLVVLAVLVGVGLMMRSNFHVYRAETWVQAAPGFSQRGPEGLPYGEFQHMRGPGMMGRGFNPLGEFFGGLLSLGFLVLVVLGIIWLVRRLSTPASVVAIAAAAPEPMPAASVHSCQKCGKPIQDDWKVCPHCGKKV